MDDIYLLNFLIAYDTVMEDLKAKQMNIRFLDRTYILDKIKTEMAYF